MPHNSIPIILLRTRLHHLFSSQVRSIFCVGGKWDTANDEFSPPSIPRAIPMEMALSTISLARAEPVRKLLNELRGTPPLHRLLCVRLDRITWDSVFFFCFPLWSHLTRWRRHVLLSYRSLVCGVSRRR